MLDYNIIQTAHEVLLLKNRGEKVALPVGPISGFAGNFTLSAYGSSTVIWFDGSNELMDWRQNIRFHLREDDLIVPYKDNGKTKGWNSHRIHRGFYHLYRLNEDRLRNFVLVDLPWMAEDNSRGKIVFAGHSLGAAQATIAARDFAYNFPELESRIRLYLFGSPRVGNRHFVDSYHRHIPKSYIHRFRHGSDVVTGRPGFWMGYRHVGDLEKIGDRGFPLNIYPYSVADHLLNGYQMTLSQMVNRFSAFAVEE